MSSRLNGGLVKLSLAVGIAGAWWLGGFAFLFDAISGGIRSGSGPTVAQRAEVRSKFSGTRQMTFVGKPLP